MQTKSIGSLDPTPLAALVNESLPFDTHEIEEMELSSMAPGSLLSLLRIAVDGVETLESLAKRYTKLKGKVTQALIDKMKADEVDKLSNDEISVSLSSMDTVKVDGDWDEIQRSLVNQGYGYVWQRRITAKKLREAFDSGLSLPEGISLGEIPKLSHRRKMK